MEPGGTSVSPSNAHAAAQAATQAAGTVINFGAGSTLHGGQYDQTAKATATATASQGPAGVTSSGDALPGTSPNYILIGTIAGAALLIVATIIITRK
jgi:hypothetical protein